MCARLSSAPRLAPCPPGLPGPLTSAGVAEYGAHSMHRGAPEPPEHTPVCTQGPHIRAVCGCPLPPTEARAQSAMEGDSGLLTVA